MLRSKSVSSLGSSSVLTGDSLQMAIEGQWDETVSLVEIHQGIVQHLTLKLEKLKRKYMNLKFADETKKERMMKKIVAARVSYQRYMNVTKDVLKNCEEFMRVRRDTPGSRIAFIRHAQDYFSQAKEFIKLDISLKKLSPALLNYVQPKSTDSPTTYRRKRDMCKAMSLVIANDKCSLSTNGFTPNASGRSWNDIPFKIRPTEQVYQSEFPGFLDTVFPIRACNLSQNHHSPPGTVGLSYYILLFETLFGKLHSTWLLFRMLFPHN